jgi:hypothetical protein
MPHPTIPSTSLPGILLSCAVNLPTVSANFPGLIALGPSHNERDILYQCCHVLETQTFSVNGTECLQTAMCKVGVCGLEDPSYACVALVRRDWKVEGAFACLEGVKKSAGRKSKGIGRTGVLWVVVAVALGVLGCGVL